MSSLIGPFRTRAQLHNSALPSANTNLITDITASAMFPAADQGPYRLIIYACSSIAGNLNLRRTRAATTVTEQIAVLAANIPQTITVYVDQAETINLQLSTTTGTMLKLLVIEQGIV